MTDTSAAEAQPSALPLFYQRPEVLSPEVHGALGLKADRGYAFSATANSVPVTVGEFSMAARAHPVVFTASDTPAPVAVLGLRNGQNLFVDAAGKWAKGEYVPAYIRRYPFAFMRDEVNDRLLLCIDPDAGHVGEGAPHPFFADGKPTETTEKALEFCKEFQRDHEVARRLGELLEKHGLLAVQEGNFTVGKEKLTVGPFRAIDQAKLDALPDAAFLELRKAGALAFIYTHLMSMVNWRALVLRDQERRAA